MVSKNEIVSFLKDGNRVSEWFTYIVLGGLILLASVSALAQSGSVYGNRGVQTISSVTPAVVLQTRAVKVATETSTRYAGVAAGAALGGGLGVKLGKNSHGASTVLGIVGAALGGLAGNKATDALGESRAVEYIVQVVRPDSSLGDTLAVTQPDPAEVIAPGESVFVINTAGTFRVVKVQGMQMLQPATWIPNRGLQVASPAVPMVDAQPVNAP